MASNSNLLKGLLVPAAFGVAAALLSFIAMSQKTRPIAYAAVAKPMKAGVDVFAKESFEEVLLVEDIKAFVPKSEQASLYGLVAPRDFEQGDILLRRDIVPAPILGATKGSVAINVPISGVQFEPRLLRNGSNVGFVIPKDVDLTQEDAVGGYRIIGPFRVLSVGRRVSSENDLAAIESERSESRVETISIEIPEGQIQGNSESPDLIGNVADLMRAVQDETVVALSFYGE